MTLLMDAMESVVPCIARLKVGYVSILMGAMWLGSQTFLISSADLDFGSSTACGEKAPSCNLSETSKSLTRELVCGQGCCSETLEEDLLRRSQNDFAQAVTNVMNSTSDIFSFHKSKFEGYFTEMLDQSSSDLHNMFVKTYGLLYQQNSDIFIDLFQNFHSYFKGTGNVKLTKVLKRFFSDLLQRIFILLNAHHDFNENYLSCVADCVDNIQPFGDVPSRLLFQIRHLFVAARTFVEGLAFGVNAMEDLSKVRYSDSCIRRVTRMMHCSLCSGFTCAMPCLKYCRTVTAACFQPFFTDLNATWVVYVDELVRVSERLEGAFSLANVVDPIEVTISDAIMNFQTHSDSLSTQIFSKCGQPEPTAERKRRNADVAEGSRTKKPKLKSELSVKKEEQNHLDQFLHLFRIQIKKTTFLWNSLVYVTCDMLGVNDHSASCWNGTDLIDREKLNAVEIDEFLRVPDVDFHSSTVIHLYLTQLQAMTAKLKMAVNGLHSSWIDRSDIVGYSGGSGSDSDDDDDDAEETEIQESGLSDLPIVKSFDHSDWKQTRISDAFKVNTWPPLPYSTASFGFFIFQHSFIWIVLLFPLISCLFTR